jgi:hypothetical protein
MAGRRGSSVAGSQASGGDPAGTNARPEGSVSRLKHGKRQTTTDSDGQSFHAQIVEPPTWGQGIAGSNPVSPTDELSVNQAISGRSAGSAIRTDRLTARLRIRKGGPSRWLRLALRAESGGGRPAPSLLCCCVRPGGRSPRSEFRYPTAARRRNDAARAVSSRPDPYRRSWQRLPGTHGARCERQARCPCGRRTRPCSVQLSDRRSMSWASRCWTRTRTQRAGSASVRRDRLVLVSPPARTERHTSM